MSIKEILMNHKVIFVNIILVTTMAISTAAYAEKCYTSGGTYVCRENNDGTGRARSGNTYDYRATERTRQSDPNLKERTYTNPKNTWSGSRNSSTKAR